MSAVIEDEALQSPMSMHFQLGGLMAITVVAYMGTARALVALSGSCLQRSVSLVLEDSFARLIHGEDVAPSMQLQSLEFLRWWSFRSHFAQ